MAAGTEEELLFPPPPSPPPDSSEATESVSLPDFCAVLPPPSADEVVVDEATPRAEVDGGTELSLLGWWRVDEDESMLGSSGDNRVADCVEDCGDPPPAVICSGC